MFTWSSFFLVILIFLFETKVSKTKTETFFETQFSQTEMKTFFETRLSKIKTETFISETKFSETETDHMGPEGVLN